ncbi:MAG TPA: hypothetical protein VHF47_12880 [Acidimicrobiales bacterium]|nr:hypothetical protein [Acidimicrobiales bacterium]
MKELPPRVPDAAWLPSELPLPPGSYTIYDEVPPPGATYRRAQFVIPLGLHEFGAYVRNELTGRGWVFGQYEAEPGEWESILVKAPTIGAYRVRSTFCDESYSELLIVLEQVGGH